MMRLTATSDDEDDDWWKGNIEERVRGIKDRDGLYFSPMFFL